MAKKKAVKNVIAEQIKALIDAGDFQGAQALISGQVQNRVTTAAPKKKGRPPKQVAQTVVTPEPAPLSSPANNNSCIAPSKRVDVPRESRKIEKDGKVYIASIKVPWTAPNKIVFKEDKSVERNPGVKYPDRVPPRDPAEQIQYICYKCDRKVMLYPGQGPDNEMLYTCDYCMKKSNRR
jgi:hypothetical protein